MAERSRPLAQAEPVVVPAVLIGSEEFTLSPERPFVFGRADAPGVTGLDARDMGISAVAGSVEAAWGLWWVLNHSRKRRLLLDDGGGGAPQRLDCGHRYAINVCRLGILVPGAVYTHHVEVVLPTSDLACFQRVGPSSDTIGAETTLSERDRDVVVALLSGYLDNFPRRQARPRTYQEAAELLGPPWTRTTVRKQIERLKQRLARSGAYFEGPQANYDLADHLIGSGLLSPADLDRLPAR
ncbi:MAG TPA: hypothetical protein VGV86_06450 [Acidimicrobiales bacterium]|nr:hypothetical protein [Acidimicrobiales bacterium]